MSITFVRGKINFKNVLLQKIFPRINLLPQTKGKENVSFPLWLIGFLCLSK